MDETKEGERSRQVGIWLDIFVLTTDPPSGECKLYLLNTVGEPWLSSVDLQHCQFSDSSSCAMNWDLVSTGSQWQAQGSPQSLLLAVPGRIGKIRNLEFLESQKARSPPQA